ncbi:membrane protein [Bizionia arctica]|uniref:Membrane protein n=1 Tax=Bizionia arctica TaxID=1495645 RepID=A0A917GVX5_9FLAO|nr:membrane protein [Bizionia arctica]
MNAQDANTVLQNVDKIMSAPKDKQGTVQIIVTDKSGDETVREAELKQKGMDKKLYRYTKPENKAGIATLSLPDDKMWLYMPSFGKAVKISLLSKSQAFTGTDFSYEDMSGIPYSSRYTPEFLKSLDPKAYLLELTPKDKSMEYSKIIMTVDKANNYPMVMEFYYKGDEIRKVATYKYLKSGKYWYAQEVTMKDIKKESSTKIVMLDLKFDQGISDDIFTVENLKQ